MRLKKRLQVMGRTLHLEFREQAEEEMEKMEEEREHPDADALSDRIS